MPNSSPEPAEKRRRAILAALGEDTKGKRKAAPLTPDQDAAEVDAPPPGKRRRESSMTRSRETERMVSRERNAYLAWFVS